MPDMKPLLTPREAGRLGIPRTLITDDLNELGYESLAEQIAAGEYRLDSDTHRAPVLYSTASGTVLHKVFASMALELVAHYGKSLIYVPDIDWLLDAIQGEGYRNLLESWSGKRFVFVDRFYVNDLVNCHSIPDKGRVISLLTALIRKGVGVGLCGDAQLSHWEKVWSPSFIQLVNEVNIVSGVGRVRRTKVIK